jgi:hypothetical protein
MIMAYVIMEENKEHDDGDYDRDIIAVYAHRQDAETDLTASEDYRVRYIVDVPLIYKAIEHGTHKGYVRERYLDMQPCQACKDAHAAYTKASIYRRREAVRNARNRVSLVR